ncbi:MAG: carboxypeptidase regulatory-like domain-containing protein, partial [Gemmatimonadales bacterium]
MPRLFRWLVASAILAAPIVSSAQVGVTTDIITGVVTDAGGRPLPGVTIEVLSLETQILRTTQTDSRGRYNVLFPDGGGQYRVTAKMIGMLPRETTLVRYADEDRLEWNVALTDQAFMMEEIAVEARLTPVRVPNAPAPGGLEGVIAGDLAFNLPISTEDLNLLAALAPGVVSVDATDSTDLAFSILGQGPEANNITLDGLSFASGLLPQEGLRVTRVVTNTYDVSRGRFSGGLVSSVSRSGANRVQGSMNYSLRDDALAFQSEQAGSIFRGTIDQHQLSGGFGGPLVRNRLFAYASAQGRLRSDRLSSLSVATFTDLNRLGVAADSVSRFESIVGTLGATDGTIVDDNRSNDLGAALLRIDYLASNNHTLTLRADWRTTDQHPTGVANTSLPESGGTSSTDGGGLMVSVASRIGLHFINEAKAYVSVSRRNSEPFVYLPAGRVRVASMMGDSAAAFQTLTFGGNSRMPSNSETITTEVSQELSWMPAGGAHRVRMGGLIHTETLDNHTAVNQLGTFTFNSLTQLEQSTPVRFTRTLAPTEQRSSTLEWAAYIGDVFRPNRNTQVTFGIRAEGNRLGDAPLYNPDLDAAFGIRTDRLPTEFDLSPRVGFSLMLGTSSNRFVRPSIILRGGAGRFRSPLPINLAAQVAAATGMSDAGLTLTCVGALVPTPDWQRYLVEESSIPSTCDGGPSLTSTFVPSAATFAEDFGAPKPWR